LLRLLLLAALLTIAKAKVGKLLSCPAAPNRCWLALRPACWFASAACNAALLVCLLSRKGAALPKLLRRSVGCLISKSSLHCSCNVLLRCAKRRVKALLAQACGKLTTLTSKRLRLSAPLLHAMTRTAKRTCLRGLRDRVGVDCHLALALKVLPASCPVTMLRVWVHIPASVAASSTLRRCDCQCWRGKPNC
jgi:hypothetical protein